MDQHQQNIEYFDQQKPEGEYGRLVFDPSFGWGARTTTAALFVLVGIPLIFLLFPS